MALRPSFRDSRTVRGHRWSVARTLALSSLAIREAMITLLRARRLFLLSPEEHLRGVPPEVRRTLARLQIFLRHVLSQIVCPRAQLVRLEQLHFDVAMVKMLPQQHLSQEPRAAVL